MHVVLFEVGRQREGSALAFRVDARHLPVDDVKQPDVHLARVEDERQAVVGAPQAFRHLAFVETVGEVVDDEKLSKVIDLVEKQASCQLYGLLKRPDEKFVTEYAYDNPKFVEDIVRDVAAALKADDRICQFIVESENFESIHNHSAYAKIVYP